MQMTTYYSVPSSIDGLRVVQDPKLVITSVRNHTHCCRYEFGDSLYPILESGQFCELAPITEKVNVGDIVFCKVNGHYMTHMVDLVNESSGYCRIVDTSGNIFGWTKEIFAIATPIPYKMSENMAFVFDSSVYE